MGCRGSSISAAIRLKVRGKRSCNPISSAPTICSRLPARNASSASYSRHQITRSDFIRAGAASALSETSAELSGALGIAVFGSLATSLYRAGMAGRLPPGLPAEAVAETSTLGGALIVAQGLPAPLADALRLTARGAFVDGLQAAAVVGTAIMVASGLLAWRMLRTPASSKP